MFERLRSVRKEQKRREKEAKERFNKEKRELKYESIFSAIVFEKMKKVDMLLKNEFSNVIIQVDEKDENLIDKYMYGEEMENYIIDKKGLTYEIKEKIIDI